MTNGEKLQEIFPNADIDWGSHPNSNVLAHFDTKETNPKTCAWFTHRWWNEEYKEPKIGHWIDAIDFAIKAIDSQDDYGMGMRNGMRYVKSLIDGKEPQYEFRRIDEEIKLGIDLGDEVVGDYGAKGVVVGIDTYEGEVLLSLLMTNHKVPQLVKASGYKTKTGRHFDAIEKLYEEMKK